MENLKYNSTMVLGFEEAFYKGLLIGKAFNSDKNIYKYALLIEYKDIKPVGPRLASDIFDTEAELIEFIESILTTEIKKEIISELTSYPKETGFYRLLKSYKDALHSYTDKYCKIALEYKLAINYLNEIKVDFNY